MEKCATAYRSATLKYAVNRFTEAHIGLSMGLSGGVTRFMQQLVMAYYWADPALRHAECSHV